jgi:16S rRNA (guanine527-N7)-methyltransferase
MVTVDPRPLDAAWIERLASLIAESPVNLVSRRDRADVKRLHIDECVLVGRRLPVAAGAAWMDLGTGGGLPGLVLAATYPSAHWTLVDARHKKIRQVEAFADALGLANVEAVHARAEDLAMDRVYRAAFDGVVSRAAGTLTVTAALARPFVGAGRVVAIRGPRVHDDVAMARVGLEQIGLSVENVERIDGTIRPTWLVRLCGSGRVSADFPKIQRVLLRADGGGPGVSTA